MDDLRTMQSQIDDYDQHGTHGGFAGFDFWGAGSIACRDRVVWRVGVFNGTADAGDRYSHGAGRAAVHGGEVDSAGGAAAGSWDDLVTLPLAFLLTRTLREQLFGVSPADPLVYFGGIVMIGIVASLAALLPARRAASIEPMQALRTE